MNALEYANAGASFLDEAEYEHAIYAFSDSLDMTRRMMLSEEMNDSPMDSRSKPADTFSYQEIENYKSLRNKRTYGLYPHPIYHDRSADKSDKHSQLLNLSAGLVFDLGLAYHLWALAGTNKEAGEDDLLLKAAHFYECGIDLQATQLERCTHKVFLALATLTNLAHIYCELGENSKAMDCFHEIISLNRKLAETESSGVDKAIIEQFYKNAFQHAILSLATPMASPAA